MFGVKPHPLSSRVTDPKSEPIRGVSGVRLVSERPRAKGVNTLHHSHGRSLQIPLLVYHVRCTDHLSVTDELQSHNNFLTSPVGNRHPGTPRSRE